MSGIFIFTSLSMVSTGYFICTGTIKGTNIFGIASILKAFVGSGRFFALEGNLFCVSCWLTIRLKISCRSPISPFSILGTMPTFLLAIYSRLVSEAMELSSLATLWWDQTLNSKALCMFYMWSTILAVRLLEILTLGTSCNTEPLPATAVFGISHADGVVLLVNSGDEVF